MKDTLAREFETVDLILRSSARTRYVDGFCLTWIKFERQLRKLTAYLIYQATAFPESDRSAKEALRAALRAKNNLKHDHFLGAIRQLTGLTMKEVLGDGYRGMRRELDQAYDFRNKIIHGQQTGHNLDEVQLANIQKRLRAWCAALAYESNCRFGYDGFAPNSLRKGYRAEVTTAWTLSSKHMVGSSLFSAFDTIRLPKGRLYEACVTCPDRMRTGNPQAEATIHGCVQNQA